MKKIEETRELKKTVQLLRKLSRSKEYDLTSPDFNEGQKIYLRKVNNEYTFSIKHNGLLHKPDRFNFHNVQISDRQLSMKVKTLLSTNITFEGTHGIVRQIFSENFDEKKVCYQRMVIPITEKPNFIFSTEGISVKYKNQTLVYTREATEINIGEKKFLLYRVVDKVFNTKSQYMVLECDTSLDFDSFLELSYSIFLGFGFVTGSFIQNEGFFFQYSSPNMMNPVSFNYSTLRGSIKLSYVSVYTNPFGYIRDSKIAKLYEGKTRTLSIEEFSTLCKKINNNNDFKSVILLFLESSTHSLVTSPGSLSIALETLANIIYDENEKALSPITDKQVAKEIRSKFKSIILEYEDKLTKEGAAIITSRIEQLNQRTNREKLLIPFKFLDIKINEEDIHTIEQRNSFLHGKSPMIRGENPIELNTEDQIRYYLYLT